MIQLAHKKADKGFNDIVAQLYEQEFKTQEKAKYEHIKQAKEAQHGRHGKIKIESRISSFTNESHQLRWPFLYYFSARGISFSFKSLACKKRKSQRAFFVHL